MARKTDSRLKVHKAAVLIPINPVEISDWSIKATGRRSAVININNSRVLASAAPTAALSSGQLFLESRAANASFDWAQRCLQ